MKNALRILVLLSIIGFTAILIFICNIFNPYKNLVRFEKPATLTLQYGYDLCSRAIVSTRKRNKTFECRIISAGWSYVRNEWFINHLSYLFVERQSNRFKDREIRLVEIHPVISSYEIIKYEWGDALMRTLPSSRVEFEEAMDLDKALSTALSKGGWRFLQNVHINRSRSVDVDAKLVSTNLGITWEFRVRSEVYKRRSDTADIKEHHIVFDAVSGREINGR
jgi:hypothetical protein